MAKTLARCSVFKHEPFLQVFRQMVCYCMEHLQGIHSYSQCCNYCRLRAGCLLLSFWTVFVFAWWNSVLDFLVIMLYCVLPGFEMGSNCFSLNVHLQNICRPNLEVPTCVPVTHRKSVGPLTEQALCENQVWRWGAFLGCRIIACSSKYFIFSERGKWVHWWCLSWDIFKTRLAQTMVGMGTRAEHCSPVWQHLCFFKVGFSLNQTKTQIQWYFQWCVESAHQNGQFFYFCWQSSCELSKIIHFTEQLWKSDPRWIKNTCLGKSL